MKTTNITKTFFLLFIVMMLSTALFAQEKPAKHDPCCEPTETHTCTDACKTEGCAAVKAKEADNNHKCTQECAKIGCAAVKVKEAKQKSNNVYAVEKIKTSKTLYECPMKCVPASDKPGTCPECNMDLKKVETAK